MNNYNNLQLYNSFIHRQLPCAILCGDPGSEGISSSSDLSFTKESTVYTTKYGFSIYDTPGINPLEEKFKQNIWVAYAFNSNPVSVLLLCVKAETRIDQTLNNVIEILYRFSKFETILCPLITWMDTVEWDEEKFRKIYIKETGLNTLLFNGNKKSANVLGQEISFITNRNQPLIIKIGCDNFLDFFEIRGNEFKILKKTREIEQIFKDAVENVLKLLSNTQEKDRMDLVFQFQHFMFENIPKMQMELANECNFTFGTEASEYGHLHHLGSKLKSILYNIRHLAQQYTSKHGVSILRKCPHCGLVWSKVSGCNGETTCGNRPSDLIESKSNIFSKFSFSLYPFEATRIGEKDLKYIIPKSNTVGVGCGKRIVWESMLPVPVPQEIIDSKVEVNLDDVKSLPDEPTKKFEAVYNVTYTQIINTKKQ